ncbi:CDKAL1-like protein, partial [Reticulomyxa filosa]
KILWKFLSFVLKKKILFLATLSSIISSSQIMSGCVPQGDRKNVLWSDVSAIGVQQIDQITYAVEQTLKVNVVKIWNTRKEESESSSTDGKEKGGGGGGERDHDHDHDNDNDEHHDDEATKTEGTTQEPTTILSKSQIQKWNNQQSEA